MGEHWKRCLSSNRFLRRFSPKPGGNSHWGVKSISSKASEISTSTSSGLKLPCDWQIPLFNRAVTFSSFAKDMTLYKKKSQKKGNFTSNDQKETPKIKVLQVMSPSSLGSNYISRCLLRSHFFLILASWSAGNQGDVDDSDADDEASVTMQESVALIGKLAKTPEDLPSPVPRLLKAKQRFPKFREIVFCFYLSLFRSGTEARLKERVTLIMEAVAAVKTRVFVLTSESWAVSSLQAGRRMRMKMQRYLRALKEK